MNLINGNTMAEIADHVIDIDTQEYPSTTDDVIYCKTDFLPGLFKKISMTGQEITLITGMADKPIQSLKDKPESVKRWFAVNATCDHPQLIHIPLGIENHKGSSKGLYTRHEWFLENLERLKQKPKKKLLYCNFNTRTNKKQRQGVVEKLKHFVLRVDQSMPFEEYCERMSECQFVVCPPGRGVDTHRLWEALYMSCIPITIKSRIYQYYTLPIIQVERWEDLTPQHLNAERKYDYEQLDISYWKKQIRNEK